MISMARGRRVKNLGWLLKHWKDVDHFVVTRGALGSETVPTLRGAEKYVDVYLIAVLRDGEEYMTEFADRTVLHGWLDRPVFRGARVVWFGHDVKVGGKEWKELGRVYERGYHLERTITADDIIRKAVLPKPRFTVIRGAGGKK